jgi:hypothetical protein
MSSNGRWDKVSVIFCLLAILMSHITKYCRGKGSRFDFRGCQDVVVVFSNGSLDGGEESPTYSVQRDKVVGSRYHHAIKGLTLTRRDSD